MSFTPTKTLTTEEADMAVLTDTPEAETGTALAVIHDDPSRALKEPDFLNQLLDEIEAFADGQEPDLSTVASRKEIASAAHRVVRTKTAIIEAGTELKKPLKKQIDAIVTTEKQVKTLLDGYRDQIRQPLSDWEDAEKVRAGEREAILKKLKELAIVTIDLTSQGIRDRIETAKSLTISENLFLGKERDQAELMRTQTLETLENALNQTLAREQQAAELKALREKEAAREREDAAREAEARLQQAAPSPAAAPAPAASEPEEEPAPEPVEDPLTETAGDLLAAADAAKLPLSVGLARKLATALQSGRVRHVKWVG